STRDRCSAPRPRGATEPRCDGRDDRACDQTAPVGAGASARDEERSRRIATILTGMREQLMRLARSRVEARLTARGYSGEETAEAVRSLRSWLDVRGAAARRRTRVVRGSTIVATAPGRIELVPFEVPLAGPGEITVEVESSVLSPGTERAQY